MLCYHFSVTLLSLSLLLPGAFGFYVQYDPYPRTKSDCERILKNPLPTGKICGSRGTLKKPQVIHAFKILTKGADFLNSDYYLSTCSNACQEVSKILCGSFSFDPTTGMCRLFKQTLASGFTKKPSPTGPKFYENACMEYFCQTFSTIPLTHDFDQTYDDESWLVDLPFATTFYGTDYNQVWVSANGFISFNPEQPGAAYANTNLPTTSLPSKSIAVFWDDLIRPPQRTSGSAGIWRQEVSYTVTAGNRAIIFNWRMQRNGVAGGFVQASLTLFPRLTGVALINYDYIDSSLGNSATIGMQSDIGSFVYSYNSASISPGDELLVDIRNQRIDSFTSLEPPYWPF